LAPQLSAPRLTLSQPLVSLSSLASSSIIDQRRSPAESNELIKK
jgi:hypothetical protein